MHSVAPWKVACGIGGVLTTAGGALFFAGTELGAAVFWPGVIAVMMVGGGVHSANALGKFVFGHPPVFYISTVVVNFVSYSALVYGFVRVAGYPKDKLRGNMSAR